MADGDGYRNGRCCFLSDGAVGQSVTLQTGVKGVRHFPFGPSKFY